jgi:hypothetical protein
MAKYQDLHLFVDVAWNRRITNWANRMIDLYRNKASTSAEPAVSAAMTVR